MLSGFPRKNVKKPYVQVPNDYTNTQLIRNWISKPRFSISMILARNGCSEAGSKAKKIGASLLIGSLRNSPASKPLFFRARLF